MTAKEYLVQTPKIDENEIQNCKEVLITKHLKQSFPSFCNSE